MTAAKQVVRIGPFKDLIPDAVKVGDLVTQTRVQVAALVMPELLIEVKCIARV